MTSIDPGSLTIRSLQRVELDEVIDWAAAEGWNPGLRDAEALWAADPEGFIGIEREGELVAAGATVSYAGRFGFMGLFIVRPHLRLMGIGRRLWFHRRETLLRRLRPGAAIGMDGVFEMQPFYARGGFRFAHRNLRMTCTGENVASDPGLVELAKLPFGEVSAFDRDHFGAPREAFLRHWVNPDGGLGLGLRDRGRLEGIGVIRPCRVGYKVGPLFASDQDVADRLFRGLNQVAVGAPLFLDVPERNAAAIALARRYGMREVFGCSRMYLGRPPQTPWDRIYGVTTLELG